MLASENIEILKSVNARKDKIGKDEAWELIKTYKTVVVGKVAARSEVQSTLPGDDPQIFGTVALMVVHVSP